MTVAVCQHPQGIDWNGIRWAVIFWICSNVLCLSPFLTAEAKFFGGTVWAESGIVPITRNSLEKWEYPDECASFGATFRQQIARGLAASIELHSRALENPNAPLTHLCKRVLVSGEVEFLDSLWRTDATLHIDSKVLHFLCSVMLDKSRIELEYDTKNHFGKVSLSTGVDLGDRRLFVNPSHNFRDGSTALFLLGDLSDLHSEFATKVDVTLQRDRQGVMDAQLGLRHVFNKGRDVFIPSLSIRNRQLNYEWRHKFDRGSSIIARLRDNKQLKMNWRDPSDFGGEWITEVDFPLSEPSRGTFKFRRQIMV